MIIGQWPYTGDILTIRRSWGCIGFYSQQIWGKWNNQRWLECHRFFFVNMIKIYKGYSGKIQPANMGHPGWDVAERQRIQPVTFGVCIEATCSPDLVATVPLPWACRERAAHLEWSRTTGPCCCFFLNVRDIDCWWRSAAASYAGPC